VGAVVLLQSCAGQDVVVVIARAVWASALIQGADRRCVRRIVAVDDEEKLAIARDSARPAAC
jgi:hypothetical protein